MLIAPLLLFASSLVQSSFQPVNHVPLPPETGDFSFVVLGDNRPAGAGQPPTQTFRSLIGEVEQIHPAFVLSSGDLVYGNEESIEAYRSECDQMKELLSHLTVPFFNAPGNHEMNDRPEFAQEYLARLGGMYGAFDFGGFRFLAICTEEIGHKAEVGERQRTWVHEQLAYGKPAFIYMHHPVFTRKGDSEGAVKGWEALASDFAASKVLAVFQAHDHVFNLQKHDGIDYYISGGAGAPLDAQPQDGGFFHFLLVQVSGGKVTISVLPLGSIDVVSIGAETRVSNYSDVDLNLGDVSIRCVAAPKAATAMMDKKGKMTPVAVRIVSVERVKGGYLAHIAVSVTKHRQTIVKLS